MLASLLSGCAVGAVSRLGMLVLVPAGREDIAKSCGLRVPGGYAPRRGDCGAEREGVVVHSGGDGAVAASASATAVLGGQQGTFDLDQNRLRWAA